MHRFCSCEPRPIDGFGSRSCNTTRARTPVAATEPAAETGARDGVPEPAVGATVPAEGPGALWDAPAT